ncbi:MAG: mannose-1-phosphate guanylyltransferase [Alistipes sp.]|nr:mannose-1-phosphate guanylyltransferase [Alistipes sp.]
MDSKKYCVIMAGGIGSRFWPISRNSRPKQFLDILGTGKTLLRSTFERFLPLVPAENFLVVTNAAYCDLVLREIPELGRSQVLCEPIGRNTAACIAYSAFRLRAMDPDAQMIVTPSDHYIADENIFREVIGECAAFIDTHDSLITIGIELTSPNTGYGYIQVDNSCRVTDNIYKVKTFTEKPGIEMATAFIESGEFYWNSGIFIWKPDTIIAEIKKSLPDMYELFDSISPYYNTAQEDEYIRTIYPECKGVSIDVGVMEKAEDTYVRCSRFGWSDIGTWGSLYDHSEKDGEGNVVPANSALFDTCNCIVKAPADKMVVVENLENFIVVDSEDVLVVCPRDNEQNIKKYIEEVKFRKGDRFI